MLFVTLFLLCFCKYRVVQKAWVIFIFKFYLYSFNRCFYIFSQKMRREILYKNILDGGYLKRLLFDLRMGIFLHTYDVRRYLIFTLCPISELTSSMFCWTCATCESSVGKECSYSSSCRRASENVIMCSNALHYRNEVYDRFARRSIVFR